MKTFRREFLPGVRLEITKRATDPDGRIHCERCGLWCETTADYEIDHIVAEGIRSNADKRITLRAVDGQLLCKAACHRGWKTPKDIKEIAKTKRLEAKPKSNKIAAGPTAIARRYGLDRPETES